MKWLTVTLLTLLAAFTRLYKISARNTVIWDEAHFGKFASYYLKRHFYFDLHPPLGKMLNSLPGFLAGYKGDFMFSSGDSYPSSVPFVSMRIFNAVFGIMVTPVAYWTAFNLGFSRTSCILLAVMTIFGSFY